MAPFHADENVYRDAMSVTEIRYDPAPNESKEYISMASVVVLAMAMLLSFVPTSLTLQKDGNGVEGIIESGVVNTIVVGVEEGQAGVLPFPSAMNELLRMGSNVMLLLLRTVVEELVENAVSHSFHLN
jgi:hypothetical protein